MSDRYLVSWRSLATLLAAASERKRADPVASRIFDAAREQALRIHSDPTSALIETPENPVRLRL